MVEITNSDTYSESLFVNIGGSRQIELRARDGCRPVLVLGEEMAVVGGAESKFYMNGLVVTAGFIPPPALPPHFWGYPPMLPGAARTNWPNSI